MKPEVLLRGCLSSHSHDWVQFCLCDTNSVMGRRHHFFSSPSLSFSSFPPTKAPSALTGAVWLLLLMPKPLKSECSSFSRQVAACPLELPKTKNPSRERDCPEHRLTQESCAKGKLYSDASHGWHNYLSGGLEIYYTGLSLFHGFFCCSCAIMLPPTSVSNIRGFEVQETRYRKGCEGFLKFQKSSIAFR